MNDGDDDDDCDDSENSGMNQKLQEEVVQGFTGGKYNVLVSTSIGEEGLDIGQVDLIIAYDAVGSATRMTQRFGRTGRKRSGKVITLVTKEEKKKIAKARSDRKKIDKQLQAVVKNASNGTASGRYSLEFNRCNPRMLPYDVYPTCIEKEFNVGTFHSSQVAGIGASQSNKKANKKNNKTEYATITNSQQLLLDNEFGWNNDSQKGDTINDDVDDDVDCDDDDMMLKRSAYRISLLNDVRGQTCSNLLQGSPNSRIEGSLRSKAFVKVLQQCKREYGSNNDSDDDCDIDEGVLEEEGCNEDTTHNGEKRGKSRKIRCKKPSPFSGFRGMYAAANNGTKNGDNDDDFDDFMNFGMVNGNGSNSNHNHNHGDGGGGVGDDNEPNEMATLTAGIGSDPAAILPPNIVATDTEEEMIEKNFGFKINSNDNDNDNNNNNDDDDDEDDDEYFERIKKKKKQKKQENIMILSNSQDEEEWNPSPDISTAAPFAAPPVNTAPPVVNDPILNERDQGIVVYSLGQRVELFDDGKWWSGKILSRSLKREECRSKRRKKTPKKYIYVIESCSNDCSSISQDAWTVYDVEPDHIRTSVPSLLTTLHNHQMLRNLSSNRRIRSEEEEGCEDKGSWAAEIIPPPPPPPPPAAAPPPPAAAAALLPPRPSSSFSATSGKEKGKRKRLRPAMCIDGGDSDEEDSDDGIPMNKINERNVRSSDVFNG
jgi:superfamily II DNA/RNA helicase